MTALTLRASAPVVDSIGAMLSIRYNGTARASIEVRSAELVDYRIELGVPIDGGVLEFVFTNATDTQGLPLRHVRIDAMQLGSTTVHATDSLARFDRGAGSMAFDGLDLQAGRAVLVEHGSLRLRLPTATEIAAAQVTPLPTGYFVDAETGNDSHPGTAAQPWRSLTRASNMSLQAGQGLFLRCGRTWREPLVLNARQLKNGSMVAGYGPECLLRKAVISGADDFTGTWQKSGNVWSRSLPAGTPKISQLFVNGQALRTAQWPDAGNAMHVQARVGDGLAGASRVQLSGADAAALAGKDLSGATAQMRTQPWVMETRRTVALVGDAVLLDRAMEWPLDAGEGFVLQDKLWMLDNTGEFFHDTATQRLYLIAPATGAPGDINAARVEGSVRDVALAISQRSNLTLRNLALDAAREDGLRMIDAAQPQLAALQARDNGRNGLHLEHWQPLAAGTPGPSITHNLLASNGQHGIVTINIERATVQYNEVLATGTEARHRAGVIAAITTGPGGRIEHNRVDGAGYLGIAFSPMGGSVITGNHITNYCQRLSDCAAIYGWAGRAQAYVAMSSSVEGNRIGAGTAQLEGAVGNGREVVAGVYLDDFLRGATVRNNVVAGAPVGVFLHNASDVTVEGNHIWLPTLVGLWASMDQPDGDWMRNNQLRNNEIVPLVTADISTGMRPSFKTSQSFWFFHATAGAAGLAPGRNTYSGNRVMQLQGTLAAHALVRGPAGEQMLDALGWQALNASEPLPWRPVRYDAMSLQLGPELLADGDFDDGLARWQIYTHPDGVGFGVQHIAAGIGCTGGCVRFQAGHNGDLLANWPVTLRTGASYVYRWTAGMPSNGSVTVGSPYIGRDGTPYDNMADSNGYVTYLPRRAAAGDVLNFEAFFTAKGADPARLNLQLETLRTPVTFDKVSVREVVSMTVAAPGVWAVMVMTPANMARSIGCSDLGWAEGCSALSADGQPVALPLSMPAAGQRLLLRADTALRR